jgi:flagellar motor switch protein FliN
MSSSPISSSSSDLPAMLAPMFDVQCTVDFVIGTGVLKMRDCLRLERNSVVRLTQSAGSDLEVRVHGVPVAHGEVVIIDDDTALRISRISAPAGVEAD